LGHNRLSINDLSPDGHQPIHSDDGHIHAVVNGEIYDFDRLHETLARDHGYQFKGRSDSEVLVALYKVYGAPVFLDHLRGEFAFVLYDDRDGKVIASRDRFGIKPLFYTVLGDSDNKRLLIAAEAKAFMSMGWEPEWDVQSLVEGSWQFDDQTLFKGVKKVLPGYWMEVSDDGEMFHHRYWDTDYKDKVRSVRASQREVTGSCCKLTTRQREVETRSMEEMVQGVRGRLIEAIKLRLRADVPIGIYLSGGIDSSLLAGIVTNLVHEEGIKIGSEDATKRVSCFTIQFPSESGFDESPIAQRTADWLGVKLFRKDVNEAVLAQNFADSAYHCEHHNGDLNSVGKFTLSTLPRELGFKVILTGEGADELFAGYPLFPLDLLHEPDLALPDFPLTKDTELLENLYTSSSRDIKLLFDSTGIFNHGWDDCEAFKLTNNSSMVPGSLVWQPYLEYMAPWVRERWAGLDCRNTVSSSHSPEVLEKMQHKWHPLHTSDHHLADYVNNLPPSLKMWYTPDGTKEKSNQGIWFHTSGAVRDVLTEKYILREAGKDFITEELYRRKKHPYSAPSSWPVEGPIHQMFTKLLTKERVENLGFLDWSVVEHALNTGFGPGSIPRSFRLINFVGAWVVMSERFGIKKADKANWVVFSNRH
jgi:asparagine synthase (glutamine-hydrolysing)